MMRWAGVAALLVCPLVVLAQDAKKEPLHVGTRAFPPWSVHNADGSWTGISIEVWKRVAEDQKLPYVIAEYTPEQLLHPEKHGIDVVVSTTAAPITEEATDLTHPFFVDGVAIVARVESGGGVGAVLRRVINVRFLQGLGILALVVLGFGLLVWRVERTRTPDEFGGTALRGIAAGMFWTVESLFGKGKALSRALPARMLTLAWVTVSMLVVSGVTARLASEFTVQQLENSVTGVQDLARVRVGVMASKEATTKNFAERFLDGRGIPYKRMTMAQDEALAALAGGEIDALLGYAGTMQYLVKEHHAGRLTVLPARLHQVSFAFALPTGSALRKPLNLSIHKLHQQGVFKPIFVEYLGTDVP